MLTSNQARFAAALVLPLLLAAPVALAAAVYQNGLTTRFEEALMLVWVLSFTIALPAALIALPALAALSRRRPASAAFRWEDLPSQQRDNIRSLPVATPRAAPTEAPQPALRALPGVCVIRCDDASATSPPRRRQASLPVAA